MTLFVPRRQLLKVLGGAVAAPFVSRAAFGDTPFTTFGFPGSAISGTTAGNRNMPDRIANGRNVLDYGVAGNGSTDDAAALTNCFAQKGYWYLPPVTFQINSSITLPNSTAGPTGEDLFIFGYGATIQGNFADWLMKRVSVGNDNFGPKVIAGINFINKSTAGGLVFLSDWAGARIVDCIGQMDGAGGGVGSACSLGFICRGSNGNYQVQNCVLTAAGLLNQIGIAVPAGLGSLVECCNLHGGFDIAVMMGGGGAAGGRVSCNRIEVVNTAIMAGWGGDYQKTTGTSTASGSNTVLPLSNSLVFDVGNAVNVRNSSASGSTIVSKTSTSITLSTGGFVSVPAGTWINRDGPGGAGIHVESNEGEGNGINIYLINSQAAVVQANTFQMYHGLTSGITTQGGVAFGDGLTASVIEANSLTGQCTDSVYFYNGVFGDAGGFVPPFLSANTGQFGNSGGTLIQNNAGPAELCMVQSAVTNGNVFSLYDLPRWLNNAINVLGTTVFVSSPYCTIAGTTTVTAASSSTLTLSANISGTQPANNGFNFWTGSQFGTPIGQVSVV